MFIPSSTQIIPDGVHFVERKQETLSSNFSKNVLKEAIKSNYPSDEIVLNVKNQPIIREDTSFANLATRVVDEVVANQSGKSLARQVLEQAGIRHQNGAAEPKIFNGHLRHVGRRARKISRQQQTSTSLRIKRVKRHVRGPPPNVRRQGAPPQTRARPALGMEDEVNRSARDFANHRGKTKKKRRLFRR